MMLKKLLFIAVLVAVARATDDETPDATDEKNAETKYGKGDAGQRLLDCNQVKREVKWSTDKQEVVLDVEADKEDRKESKAKGRKCDSDLKVKVDQKSEGVRTIIDLKTENGDAKTRFGFDFRAFEIVEFVDTGSPGLDANDTKVQVFTIGKGMNDDKGDYPKDGDANYEGWESLKGQELEDIVKDGQNEGCFSFGVNTAKKTFAAVGRYCSVPQVSFEKDSGKEYIDKYNVTHNVTLKYTLSPNVVKFDYLINKFPYKQTGTKLAIRGKLITKTKFKIKKIGTVVNDNGKSELDVNGGAGGLSWAKKVFADGVEKDVIITSDTKSTTAGEDENRYYAWTFDTTDRVEHFIWDPEVVGDMGGYGDTNGAATAVPTALAFAGLVAFFF